MKIFRLAAISALIVFICFGEQPPAPSKNDTPEVSAQPAVAIFKTSTNLVQVPVIVRDKDGHAVGDLHAEDFKLSDNGKSQEISRFTVEKMGTPPTSAAENSQSAAADGSIPSRFIAYLADDINLIPEDFAQGRKAAIQHLATLRPSDRGAVYSASGSSAVGFTADHEVLRQALNGINSLNREATWQDPTLRCLNTQALPRDTTFYRADLIVSGDPGAMQDCVGQNASDPSAAGDQIVLRGKVMADAESILYRSERDLSAWLHALDSLIDKLAVLPGDRHIVLLSPGTYVPRRYQKEADQILAKAVRSKVVISGVDVRGLYGAFSGDSTALPTRYGLGETAARVGFMTDLTAGTGGIFIHGQNDLEGSLRRVDSVPEYIYVLGFSPGDLKVDGSRHQLKITLAAARGFTVQARDGYFADSYSSDPADEAKQQIQDTFFSDQEIKGLPVRLQTQFFKDGDDATITANARVDLSKLPFRKDAGRNDDNLTLVIGLFDQNGNSVAAYEKVIEMRLKDESLDTWMKSGVENSTDFNVKPGKYLVRLVVRDSEGHSMAAQSTGVEIPW